MKEEIGTYRWLILRYLLVSLACFSYLNVKAAETVGTGTDDYGIEYTVYDDGTAILTNGKKITETAITLESKFYIFNYGFCTLKGIADGAFTNAKITYIRFMDGLEEIGESAFQNCKSLKTVILSPSIKTIGHNAFEGCDNLTNIYCPAYEPPTITGGENLLLPNSVNFYIPEATVNAYICASFPWEGYKAYKELDEVADNNQLSLFRPDLILKPVDLSISASETKDLHLYLTYPLKFYKLSFQIAMPSGLTICKGNGEVLSEQTSESLSNETGNNVNLNVKKSGNDYEFEVTAYNSTFSADTNPISFTVKTESDFKGGFIKIQNVKAWTDRDVNKDPIYGREKSYIINEVPVESIALDHTDLQIEIGETAQLKATLIPNAPTDSSVTWSSSDNSVATVSENGTVTGIKQGNDVVITAMSYNGYKARCTVTVTAPLYGDANKDKQLSQEDVEYIRDYILELHNGLSESEKDRLDVNRDNKVNVVDIVTLIELIQSGK